MVRQRRNDQVFNAHNILRQYMINTVQGANPTAIEGYIGNLNPRDAIRLANIIDQGRFDDPALNNLMNAAVKIENDPRYEQAMERERMGVDGGFDGMDFPEAHVGAAQAGAQGQIGAANAGALGQIFQGNPGAFTEAFRPRTAWDYYQDPMGNFAPQFMQHAFLSSLPNMVQNLNQGIARDMYANRNQRNWSKMMASQEAFRNRYLDIMESVMSGRNKVMGDMVAGLPDTFGALGQTLKGLNMFNPEGPQGVEDVDGTALVSQAVDPTRVDVQSEIDIQADTPLQAALAGKLRTEAADDLFADQEQAAGQYAEGLGQRVAGIGSGLAGDAEARQQSAVNMAAKNNRETNAAINQMQNAAQRQQMATNFGTGMFNDMTGVFS